MKLNLGCGRKKLEGFVGVDNIKTDCVDVVHDLNSFPFPFESDSIAEVMMDNQLQIFYGG